jgi:hypothetical protein
VGDDHFLDFFALFLFLRASFIDSRILAKARLRALEGREDDEDEEEEDQVEELLLGLVGFLCFTLEARV